MSSERALLPNVCPRCGKKIEGVDRWTWKHTDEPCAAVADCFAHLRTRVEELEAKLDAHNF